VLYKIKKENLFIIGIFSLLIANMFKFFDEQYVIFNFFEGMFTGISLVFNLSFLIRLGIEKRMNIKGIKL
jgi:hypothetical protein